jgi:hypothetical protein
VGLRGVGEQAAEGGFERAFVIHAVGGVGRERLVIGLDRLVARLDGMRQGRTSMRRRLR